jgi:hypothetical protein
MTRRLPFRVSHCLVRWSCCHTTCTALFADHAATRRLPFRVLHCIVRWSCCHTTLCGSKFRQFVKRKLRMPYIRHASVDIRIDNCNTMLECVCNVDWDWWKWSCPLLDRTCAQHILLWDKNKCLVAELYYSAYRVTIRCSALHWSELFAGNITLVQNWIENLTSRTDVKQEVWRSSGFRRCVAEKCALLAYYSANNGSFLLTFRYHLSGPILRVQESIFLNPIIVRFDVDMKISVFFGVTPCVLV